MRRHAKLWFVLADGARMRIFRHVTGENADFTEIAHDLSPEALLPAADLVSDRAGRSFESAAPARHAIEPRADPHEAAEIRFLATVAEFINPAGQCGDFDGVILAAPPAPWARCGGT